MLNHFRMHDQLTLLIFYVYLHKYITFCNNMYVRHKNRDLNNSKMYQMYHEKYISQLCDTPSALSKIS
jgi:hypothetical protein